MYPDLALTVPILVMTISKGTIHMVGKKESNENEPSMAIRPCLSGYVLSNWSMVDLYTKSSKTQNQTLFPKALIPIN